MTRERAPGESAGIAIRQLDELVAEAIAFHGHLCPGLVLGARMARAGCRELGLDRPREAGKRLVVFVEIDRCATDAIQVLTGVSLGKRTLKFLDWGRTAATFADRLNGTAVRVAARDDARDAVTAWAPGEADPRRAQVAAYRVMPETLLLRLERVAILPGWLDRRRTRERCAECGAPVTYGRELLVDGRTLCRFCAGEGYYVVQHSGA